MFFDNLCRLAFVKKECQRLCRLMTAIMTVIVAGNISMGVVTGPAHAQMTTNAIERIEIHGAQRIEPTTIKTYLDIKPGDPLTQFTLDKGLKSLFATGLFADVRLQEQEGVVHVHVKENPIVNKIAFEGNDKIKNEELLNEIQLRPRQVLTRSKVQSDVTRLYQIYRRNGRFSANIDPKVIKLEQNRVNLVFEIDEGPVTKVRSIRFIGNKRFDDSMLRSEISTQESRWYKFLTSNDRYDPDRMSFDKELLRRFYLEQGYADFRIISAVAELSQNKEHFFITITVEEGDRYKVDQLEIESELRDFDSSVLREELVIESGDWYNADKVKQSIDNMTDRLGNLQFAFVDVSPKIERNRETNTIDLTFKIEETPRVFVERIEISGNVRTVDRVIRREMELVEGDPFNKAKLAESEQNIRDLGYFEQVNVKTLPGDAPDKTTVDINVTEKSTGELSLGAGFSTADGPLADFRIRERNFLGKGQDLLFATTIAGERTEFDVSFTEPYFLGRDLSAGLDAFHITRDLQDESSFDQRRTGGGFHFGYPLAKDWRQSIRYRLERNEITDVQANASRFILEQEGERITSAVSQRLTYDNRDSKLFPTEGYNFWVNTEFAGIGGDAEFVSGKLGGSYYYPVAQDWVLNVLAEIGAIEGLGGQEVAINDRFYLGGATLRGFERAGVGPRDLATDDALGGNRFYRGTVELSFPLGLPEELGVKGHAFSDVGSLWELDESVSGNIADTTTVRASAGLGLSWRSPFGPIRVDLATPYAKEDFDVKEAFRFSFGTRF